MSEPSQDLVWREWLIACWPWVASSSWIFCSMQGLEWVCWAWKMCVMPSWPHTSATCTLVISGLSVGVLTSLVDQIDDSCDNHCGPVHHNVLWINFLLMLDHQDWIEMARVSRFQKMVPSVPHKCLPFVWRALYPGQFNGRICPSAGFINCGAKGACGPFVQLVQHHSCTEFQPWYFQLF